MAFKRIALFERIQLDEVTGCWNWKGSKVNGGYGIGHLPGTGYVLAHRLAAHLWLGYDLADTRIVCHKCDNPACFNPKHLFIGTRKDNMQDCVRKGRNFQSRKTCCPKGHPYTEENTMHAVKDGYEYRRCKTCSQQVSREWKSKNPNWWKSPSKLLLVPRP